MQCKIAHKKRTITKKKAATRTFHKKKDAIQFNSISINSKMLLSAKIYTKANWKISYFTESLSKKSRSIVNE